MKIIGVICEYNPFHLGHEKQFHAIREHFGENCAIICLMSGNFVQRGHPAIFDKSLRARAALECGADLILELPIACSLSSAEGFAAGSVAILGKFCDYLCFGAEQGNAQTLTATAQALLSPEFSGQLHAALDTGLSFPAARQNALENMGLDSRLLSSPNDILGVEYCKAILSQKSPMQPFVIRRPGSYHDAEPDPQAPSATSLRERILSGGEWLPYLPQPAARVLKDAPVHSLSFGERAVLARLRTMSEAEFQTLPFGSEGLWRKLMRNARTAGSLEDILTGTKSKRYTRTRLDRMVMCAFLGLTWEDLSQQPHYVRVLGFRESGKAVLKLVRQTGVFPHTGEHTGHPFEIREGQFDDLYALFRKDGPGAAGETARRRVCII